MSRMFELRELRNSERHCGAEVSALGCQIEGCEFDSYIGQTFV